MSKADIIVNSKSEWGSTRIPRLAIEVGEHVTQEVHRGRNQGKRRLHQHTGAYKPILQEDLTSPASLQAARSPPCHPNSSSNSRTNHQGGPGQPTSPQGDKATPATQDTSSTYNQQAARGRSKRVRTLTEASVRSQGRPSKKMRPQEMDTRTRPYLKDGPPVGPAPSNTPYTPTNREIFTPKPTQLQRWLNQA